MNYSIYDLLEMRTKRVPGEAYKLQGALAGMDVPFVGNMEFDQSSMSIVIPFASGHRRDGVGDLLEVGGIDTSRHKLNPVVLFDHGKVVTLPVAQAEDPLTREYTVQIDPVDKTARAKAFFYQGKKPIHNEGYEPDQYFPTGQQEYDHALFCEQLYDMMVKRYIRAGSIGYQVIAARDLMPDYEKGTPKGLHLLKTLLLEVSAVVLPANQDTVAKALSLPQVCGKPMSPMLVKSLAPYAPPRKAMMGYEEKAYDKHPHFSEPHSWTMSDEDLKIEYDQLDNKISNHYRLADAAGGLTAHHHESPYRGITQTDDDWQGNPALHADAARREVLKRQLATNARNRKREGNKVVKTETDEEKNLPRQGQKANKKPLTWRDIGAVPLRPDGTPNTEADLDQPHTLREPAYGAHGEQTQSGDYPLNYRSRYQAVDDPNTLAGHFAHNNRPEVQADYETPINRARTNRRVVEDNEGYDDPDEGHVPRKPGRRGRKSQEIIPGGLASGKKPSSFDPAQLKAGMKVEMEHTDDPRLAREIAMDHLTEDPAYYQKLSRMEGKTLPRQGRKTAKDRVYAYRRANGEVFGTSAPTHHDKVQADEFITGMTNTLNTQYPGQGYHVTGTEPATELVDDGKTLPRRGSKASRHSMGPDSQRAVDDVMTNPNLTDDQRSAEVGRISGRYSPLHEVQARGPVENSTTTDDTKNLRKLYGSKSSDETEEPLSVPDMPARPTLNESVEQMDNEAHRSNTEARLLAERYGISSSQMPVSSGLRTGLRIPSRGKSIKALRKLYGGKARTPNRYEGDPEHRPGEGANVDSTSRFTNPNPNSVDGAEQIAVNRYRSGQSTPAEFQGRIAQIYRQHTGTEPPEELEDPTTADSTKNLRKLYGGKAYNNPDSDLNDPKTETGARAKRGRERYGEHTDYAYVPEREPHTQRLPELPNNQEERDARAHNINENLPTEVRESFKRVTKSRKRPNESNQEYADRMSEEESNNANRQFGQRMEDYHNAAAQGPTDHHHSITQHYGDEMHSGIGDFNLAMHARQRNHNRRLQGGKTFKQGNVPVPHGDLSKTKVPPAKWKPGLGAIKSADEENRAARLDIENASRAINHEGNNDFYDANFGSRTDQRNERRRIINNAHNARTAGNIGVVYEHLSKLPKKEETRYPPGYQGDSTQKRMKSAKDGKAMDIFSGATHGKIRKYTDHAFRSHQSGQITDDQLRERLDKVNRVLRNMDTVRSEHRTQVENQRDAHNQSAVSGNTLGDVQKPSTKDIRSLYSKKSRSKPGYEQHLEETRGTSAAGKPEKGKVSAQYGPRADSVVDKEANEFELNPDWANIDLSELEKSVNTLRKMYGMKSDEDMTERYDRPRSRRPHKGKSPSALISEYYQLSRERHEDAFGPPNKEAIEGGLTTYDDRRRDRDEREEAVSAELRRPQRNN